jgi:hypothetical protein
MLFSPSPRIRGCLRRAARSLVCWIAVLSLAPPAHSWGTLGHRIVAGIAEREAGDRARSRLRIYLEKEGGLGEAAVWASDMHLLRPETERWHFVRIPPGAMEFDLNRDCPERDCITAKIREFEGIARLGIRDRDEVAEAIKFLIHLAGDLHQPLHTGYAEDHSGRDIPVVFSGRQTNLYDLWDSTLVETLGPDEEAIIDRLLRGVTDDQRREWRQGTPRDWTWESHSLAVRVAYGALPDGSPKAIGPDYLGPAMRVVEGQLTKAGIRLAKILDQVWP